MMQAVAPFEEVVTIAPKPKMIRFRKGLIVAQWVISVVNLLMTVIALLVLHMGWLALINALTGVILSLSIRFLRSQTNRPQVKPIIYLTREGVTIDGVPAIGTILWDEIAAIEPTRFLLSPVVRLVPRDRKRLRARLGAQGKNLWMYRMPGGLGISCTPFSLSPKAMAGRINDYRAVVCSAQSPDTFVR